MYKLQVLTSTTISAPFLLISTFKFLIFIEITGIFQNFQFSIKINIVISWTFGYIQSAESSPTYPYQTTVKCVRINKEFNKFINQTWHNFASFPKFFCEIVKNQRKEASITEMGVYFEKFA